MYIVCDEKTITDIFYHHTESKCIAFAIADLQSDLRKVCGKRATVKPYLPMVESGYMVIGSLENATFRGFVAALGLDVSPLEGQWERYMLATFGTDDQNLLICGSDDRGTMWGIYDFCERYLGVDPMYFWTDNEPQPQLALTIPPMTLMSQPPTFQFRGWFINDEDLLTEWWNGGGARHIDYPYYQQVTHQGVIARVIEAALRLKQNLLIPASFVDILNPPEENLVRMVTERGMFITQHHVEPLGVSHFGFDNYWQRRGEDIPASYVQHPEAFAEVWTAYLEKWAQYENVIWQLGLRGRGDRPVWFNDSQVPPTMAERGALISAALAKQAEIVETVLGHRDFLSTTTLWMEGSELHRQGHLRFPEDTIVIFADHGSTQMMLEDFFETEREAGRRYGVYHHVAFWSAGPHLVEGTSLEKLAFNYEQAVEKGDTAYSILNVSNLREVALGAAAVAAMTWDWVGFDLDSFLCGWMERQYGTDAREGVLSLYRAFQGAYFVLDDTLAPDQMLLLDGVIRRRGLKFLDILEGKVSQAPGKSLGKWGQIYERANIDTTGAFITFHKQALAESLTRWHRAFDIAYHTYDAVVEDRKPYFVDHFIVQLEIITGLTAWCYHLCLAAEAKLAREDAAQIAAHVRPAIFALEKLLLDRQKAAHGKWRNWYRGDRKMDLPGALTRTREVFVTVQGGEA